MTSPVSMIREWQNDAIPTDIKRSLPTTAHIISACTNTNRYGYTMGQPYPDANSPIFWIKYGSSIVWNELDAQNMAHQGLRDINSTIKAPAVYYGCKVAIRYRNKPDSWPAHRTYLVMEYIRGKTADDRLKATDDDATKHRIYQQIAFAMSELHRIPVPQNSRPAAINGGRIRHDLFPENEAALHYRDVDELEKHLDLGKFRIENLAKEPMVFCYSDIWLGNFIIDDDGNITVINFEDTSILPSSFPHFVLAGTRNKIGRDTRDLVVVPKTEGIDNTNGLIALAQPMLQGGGSLNKAGRKLLGSYTVEETDIVNKPVLDDQGEPFCTFVEPFAPLPAPEIDPRSLQYNEDGALPIIPMPGWRG